jgi:hypothetical protein
VIENGSRDRVTREEFGNGEGTDIVGAGAASKWQTESRSKSRWDLCDQRKWFDGWKVWIENKEGARYSRRHGRLKSGNGMRNCRWKREISG